MNNSATSTCNTTQIGVSPVERFARKIVFRLLKTLRFGTLVIEDETGTFTFGNDTTLTATIRVYSPKAYFKVLFSGSIGAGEAYVDKLWDCDDLTNVVRIFVLNMEVLDNMEKGLALLVHPLRLAAHWFKTNSRRGAKLNILSHYDIGNEMYESFLDTSMMYSSAIFPEPGGSLETASQHKLDLICKKLELKPTDHIIEIGSGWGGFAIHAAKNYGCKVTTTTISEAQFKEAQRQIAQADLTDKIELRRDDYRDLTGQYDKLVSIEMIEAVGNSYLPLFFQKCGELVKKDGMMLIQAITIRDQKFKQYTRSVDFIQRHVFPGGCLLSNRRMVELICDKSDLVVRNLEDYGVHYGETIKRWRKRFAVNFPSLERRGYDERFRRLWNFYFCYCEGGFIERAISVVQLVATGPEYSYAPTSAGYDVTETTNYVQKPGR